MRTKVKLTSQDLVKFNRTLISLTNGAQNKATLEWLMVINARCKEQGKDWADIYKDELLKQMVNLNEDFFRNIVKAISRIKDTTLTKNGVERPWPKEDNARAAAVLKAWYCLICKSGFYPTAHELLKFCYEESAACSGWKPEKVGKKVKVIAAVNPDHLRTLRDICKRYELRLSGERLGRPKKQGS